VATELQYNVFKYLYEEESDRYSSLATRAQLYFSIISVYIGAIAFKFDDLKPYIKDFSVPVWMFVATGGVLLLALLATLAAISIRNYVGFADPEDIIDRFGDEPPTDTDFLKDRIAELAAATNLNSRQNDLTAWCLTVAICLLYVGVLLHVGILLLAARH